MYLRGKRKLTFGDLFILFIGIIAVIVSAVVLWGMTQIPY